jgi:hypothetical protein
MPRIRTEGGLSGTYNNSTIAGRSGMWSMRDLERNLRTSTWPSDTGNADPYFNRVSALIHADSTNNDTNNNFLDTSDSANIPFTGTKSVYFSGTTDQITFASNANLIPGTGDFTVEFWMKLNSSSVTSPGNIFHLNVNGSLGIYVVSTAIQIAKYNTAADLTYNFTWAIGTWYHVACTREAGTARIFINGSLVASGSVATNYSAQSGAVIGGGGVTAGYVSNVRYVVGTALYNANFTVPSSPLTAVSGTKLLACQSATIVDNSTNALTPTLAGSPTVSSGNYPLALARTGTSGQGTFSPFSQAEGSWSNYFNGSTDKLTGNTSSGLNMSNGDFTVECWVYWNGTSTPYQNFVGSNSATFTGNATFFRVWGSATSQAGLRGKIGIGNPTHDALSSVYSTNSLTMNAWNHVAATRSGGIIRVFINGNLEATGISDTSTYDFGDNGYCIGASPWDGANGWFGGYISNVRIIKGSALYTASFTPDAAPLTAVSGTQLLTCQSNYFKDNGAIASSLTPAGSIMVSPFSPFTATSSYIPTVNGGSQYYNGSTNYSRIALTQATLGFGTGDFTIEFWVFFNSVATGMPFDLRTNGGAGSQVKPSIYITAAGTLSYYTSATSRISSTVTTGQWYHVAAVRSSGATKFYINGVQNATTYTDTNDYGTSSQLTIGASADTLGGQFLSGYITDVRTTKSALYTTNFSPPTSPLTTSTSPSLLLSSTNAKIIDQSRSFNVATVGTAKVSTAQSKFGGSSVLLNGTTDYLAITATNAVGANIPGLELHAGDFTIEGWYYLNALPASTATLFTITGNSTAYAAARLDVLAAGTMQLLISTTGAAWAINYTTPTGAGNVLNTGQWYHIALVRSGSNFYIFVDGNQRGVTQTNSSALYGGSGYNFIGAIFNTTYQSFLNGYVDEFRVTKYARYTANFTPPTQAFLDR